MCFARTLRAFAHTRLKGYSVDGDASLGGSSFSSIAQARAELVPDQPTTLGSFPAAAPVESTITGATTSGGC
jgi:hypothetical protein